MSEKSRRLFKVCGDCKYWHALKLVPSFGECYAKPETKRFYRDVSDNMCGKNSGEADLCSKYEAARNP